MHMTLLIYGFSLHGGECSILINSVYKPIHVPIVICLGLLGTRDSCGSVWNPGHDFPIWH